MAALAAVKSSRRPSLPIRCPSSSPHRAAAAAPACALPNLVMPNKLVMATPATGKEAAPALSPDTEPVVRPSKRVRSGSPGTTGGGSSDNGAANGGASYPMCQVDDCRADLISAKDYHKRHKVCETHIKTTRAVVASQAQRFCQ